MGARGTPPLVPPDVCRKYGLTVGPCEVDALERVLAGCSATALSCNLQAMPESQRDHRPVRGFAPCAGFRARRLCVRRQLGRRYLTAALGPGRAGHLGPERQP